jgi:hypothetical protein
LCKGICKSVSLGQKNHEKEKKSGIKHVLIIIFPRKLNAPMNFYFLKICNFIYYYYFIFFAFPFEKIFFFLRFSFVNFLIKSSFFKKIYDSKKLLCVVSICWELWRWIQECHLLWHNTFLTLLLIPCLLLSTCVLN